MIFCLAWSNYLILNMANIKMNIYPERKADLIVKSSPAIDMKIIDFIRKMDLFENIYFIDYVDFKIKFKKIRLFTLKKLYKNFYKRFVDSINNKYDKVIIAGYWNDALYMLDALWRQGNRFDIDLAEEGELSYEKVSKLYQSYIGDSIKWKVFHEWSTIFMKKKFRDRLSGNLFLYSPNRQINNGIKPVCIPKLDQNNSIFEIYKGLYNILPEWKKIYYSKRKIIFFSDYWAPTFYGDSEKIAYELIDKILDCVNEKQLIIKAHPSCTKHRLEFAKEYEEESDIYVDRDIYIFESLFCGSCMDSKVLISRHSSALIHPISLFGKEPFIVLLFKLYPDYQNFGDKIADKFVETLRDLYSNPEKIYVPNTIMEFEMNLKELYSTLYR